jgi:hypothetical protein
VLDELHTYRGRQGADVAMLVRRVRNILNTTALQCIGTSATLSSSGGLEQQRKDIAEVASRLFGDGVSPEHIIGETLRRSTNSIDFQDLVQLEALKQCVLSPDLIPNLASEFVIDPLASWIETNLGLSTRHGTETLVRAKPRSLQGKGSATQILSELTGLSQEQC